MQKLLLIALLFLLTGCQTPQTGSHTDSQQESQSKRDALYNRYTYKHNRYTQKKDGAPLSQHRTDLKDPTPQREPLSRYGNPAAYRVGGRTYRVMRSATGYKTRGIASWYGTKFHNQRTSSGEPYNMYVMTAAHKTLPLPTYIRVKNLNNGRVAVVKVNDRGPFRSNRLIDLSYAAALKLGVYPRGTAAVEIETLAGPVSRAHYYLQAGAFSTAQSANALKAKLGRLSTSPVFVEHHKRHYIVKVGPFGDKRMADSLKLRLAKMGVKGSFSVLV
jgi:rare lipoprotein A